MATLSATLPVGAATPPFDDYAGRFERMDSRINEGRGYSDGLNTTGQLAWGEGEIMEAYAEMYRATGDTGYLDQLVEHFDRVLANRDDVRGLKDYFRGAPLAGWGSQEYSPGRWHVWAVHTGMICLGPMDFVMAVKAEWRLQNHYASKAAEYEKRIEECVAAEEPYWRAGPGRGEGHYADPALQQTPVPLNQQDALGLIHLGLYLVTRDHHYKDRAAALALYFRNRLRRTADGAFDWSYCPAPSGDGPGSEDISHAAINVQFAARCAANHIIFTSDDMAAFSRTWTAHVRRAAGEWADTVCGTGGTNNHVPQAVARWLDLATYDQRIYADAKLAFANVDEDKASAANLLGLAKLAHRQSQLTEKPRWRLPSIRVRRRSHT